MAIIPRVHSGGEVSSFRRSAAVHRSHPFSLAAVPFRSACLVAASVLQFAVFHLAISHAAEPPTVEELRLAHSELGRASRNVQGTIRVFRSETLIPDALDEEPSQLGIPLVREGSVWRSEKRFRADFTTYAHRGDHVQQSDHSFAIDGEKVYEFANANLEIGILRVSDRNSGEGVTVLGSIQTMFCEPLEALWNVGGTAITDTLQRPSTEIIPNQKLDGGYSLLTSTDDGKKTRFELEPAKYYPFGYVTLSESDEVGGITVKVEHRVFSAERDGMMFPRRISHVVSLGPDTGYTEVTLLDLQPLEANSPIASPITSVSFRKFGAAYQVYRIRNSGQEELAERFERPSPARTRSGGSFRTYFLWINGLLILAIVASLTYKRLKRRQKN